MAAHSSVSDMRIRAVLFCLDSSSHEEQTNYRVASPNVFINNVRLHK